MISHFELIYRGERAGHALYLHDPSVNAACICRTTLARDLYTIFSWDLDLVLNKLTGKVPVDSIMNLASTGTGVPYIYRIRHIYSV